MLDENLVTKTVLNTLDGAVQSQGVHVGARDWLDMGSDGWAETSDQMKAYAYQAAMITGWNDDSLSEMMLELFPHLQPSIMLHTIKLLKELTGKYPVEVVE